MELELRNSRFARPVCSIYKLELLLNFLDEQYFLTVLVRVCVVFVNESSFKLGAKKHTKKDCCGQIQQIKYQMSWMQKVWVTGISSRWKQVNWFCSITCDCSYFSQSRINSVFTPLRSLGQFITTNKFFSNDYWLGKTKLPPFDAFEHFTVPHETSCV